MELPEVLIDRIVASVQKGMPDGTTLHTFGTKSVVIGLKMPGRVAGSEATPDRTFSRIEQVSVSDRDGIAPQSIAWVVRSLLETFVKMGRSVGAPWPKETAATMRVYAEGSDAGVRAWITVADEPDLVFAPISLEGL